MTSASSEALHTGSVLGRNARIGTWLLQSLVAVLLGQTLFFKFTGADESRFIFETLGVEPWGRYATGGLELIAVAMLLSPRYVKIGAALALVLMMGAVASHLGPLGIVVEDDGGTLFVLALIVAGAALGILLLRRKQAFV
ncbi:MAG: DoxX family protein [Myxococcota bacterium]